MIGGQSQREAETQCPTRLNCTTATATATGVLLLIALYSRE